MGDDFFLRGAKNQKSRGKLEIRKSKLGDSVPSLQFFTRLAGVGLGLGLPVSCLGAGLAALLGVMGIAYAYRIHVEESALIEVLGEPYNEYRQRTARLIPFVF